MGGANSVEYSSSSSPSASIPPPASATSSSPPVSKQSSTVTTSTSTSTSTNIGTTSTSATTTATTQIIPNLNVDHPLHSLINATSPPPTDPETQFYHVLFRDVHAMTDVISVLVRSAVTAPTSIHATTLSTSLRAAIHHIRQSALPGALYFALCVLEQVRIHANCEESAYLAFAAGPAEAQLPLNDRIDLARSLRTHLIIAVFDLIPVHVKTKHMHVLIIALPLLLYALIEHRNNNKNNKSITTKTDQNDDTTAYRQQSTSLIPHYADSHHLVIALLDIAIQSAPYTRPHAQLALDVIAPNGATTATKSGNAGNDANSVWDAWDALTGSTAAMNLKAGFADMMSALTTASHRWKLPTPTSATTSKQKQQQHERNHRPMSSSALSTPTSTAALAAATAAATATTTTTSSAEKLYERNSGNSSAHLLDMPFLPSLPTVNASNHDLVDEDLEHNSNNNDEDINHRNNNSYATVEQRVEMGKQALTLLNVLCHCNGAESNNKRFARTLHELSDNEYRFGRLYEGLSRWAATPHGALVIYELVSRNRRFQSYALARTDPDVLLGPILGSLKVRSSVGGIAADARVAAALLLRLCEDVGVCAAIDSVPAPKIWMPLEFGVGGFGFRFDMSVGGENSRRDSNRIVMNGGGIGSVGGVGSGGSGSMNSRKGMRDMNNGGLMLSGAILGICARAVQQSVMGRRRESDGYVACACLGVMMNVAKEASEVPGVVAERVVGLIELLGRRKRRLVKGGMERGDAKLKMLNGLIEMSVDVVVGLLKNGSSTMRVNRHVMYAVMQREKGIQDESIRGCSLKTEALTHMIGRMVRYYGKFMEGSQGMSVESVFQVIEDHWRWLDRGSVFEGVPDVTYRVVVVVEEGEREGERERKGGKFFDVYAQSLVRRVLDRDAYFRDK